MTKLLLTGIAALFLATGTAYSIEYQGKLPKPVQRLPSYPPVVCVAPNWAAEPCEDRQPRYWLAALSDFFKWLEWTKTNWLGTILVDYRPWDGTWPGPPTVPIYTTVIHDEPGGTVMQHEIRFRKLAESGDNVEIRGSCMSACTLVVAYVPKERLCFGEHGKLMFHQVRILKQGTKQGVKQDPKDWSFETTQTYLLGTQAMVAKYPQDIQMWIKDHGGADDLPGDTPYHWLTLYAGELWNMGYRKCEEPEELAVPMTIIKSTKMGTGG